ncbi:MAG: IS110 family transposase [Gammaproteobacteria bacterium]|nr:IS110 family transposase [Gammaproteobacteria bacterium]
MTLLSQPLGRLNARLMKEAILASKPGIGKTVLATLLGEARSVIRNRDYQALRCLTGGAPVTKSSVKYRRVHRRRTANQQLVDSVYHWGEWRCSSTQLVGKSTKNCGRRDIHMVVPYGQSWIACYTLPARC